MLDVKDNIKWEKYDFHSLDWDDEIDANYLVSDLEGEEIFDAGLL